MAADHRSFNTLVNDYANLRSFPALLSVIFAGTALYTFGAVEPFTVLWFAGTGGYTITAEHATIASLATFAVAFMSSETRRFESYELWEKLSIGSSLGLVLGIEYTTQVPDLLTSIGDPLGYQIGFLITIVGWAAAIR